MSLDIPDVLGSSTFLNAPTYQSPTPQNIVVQSEETPTATTGFTTSDDEDEFTSSAIDAQQSPQSGKQILNILQQAFQGALTGNSPKITQPMHIRTPLRDHQLAVVAAMVQREKGNMQGVVQKNTTTYSNQGILGDNVGSGKSLEILSFIAHIKETGGFPLQRRMLQNRSSPNIFTVQDTKKKNDKNTGSNLIVVPHIIFKQWQGQIKNQTTLDVVFLKTAKDIPEQNVGTLDVAKAKAFLKRCEDADAVLVSNTLQSTLAHITNSFHFCWNRAFIDEVDSIYITSTSYHPNTFFTWFISATWQNFLLEGHCMRSHLLQQQQEANAQKADTQDAELGDWLRREIGLQNQTSGQDRAQWLQVRSRNWLKQQQTTHALRGLNVIQCRKSFLDESQKMPPILYETILCEQPAVQRALGGILTKEVEDMLHAGNMEGVLEHLGITSDQNMNLVDAFTAERQKELERLQKTQAFKESMDYSTPQAKAVALSSLQAKIDSVKEQLKTFQERLTKIEDCPICQENPADTAATLTPCCSRVFCMNCILTSLKRTADCPMCRKKIDIHKLKHITEDAPKKKKAKKEAEMNKLLSKPKQLLKFLLENPSARVLVFNRQDNPFTALAGDCERENIKHSVLRGNKDCIDNTVRTFSKGENRVLFLQTQTTGAGINLASASHVILFHAMTPEEEKQVIGRAQRLGRTEPLKVIRFLHEGEKNM